MRLLFSAALLACTAIPAAAQARFTPRHLVQLRILSSDSTRPTTAHVQLAGDAFYALGATRVPGRVLLSGDTGSVTTPGVLEVRDRPGEIAFETLPTDPELVLVSNPSPGRRPDVYARGHSVRVVRDSSGRLQIIAPMLRTRER